MFHAIAYVPIRTPTHATAAFILGGLAITLFAGTLLPGVLSFITRRTAKYVYGVCGRCGYPVRGLSGPICPECGTDSRRVLPRRRVGGHVPVLLACGLWMALIGWLAYRFPVTIDGYLLRLVWGVTSTSRWDLYDGVGGQARWALPFLRYGLTIIFGVGGAGIIIARSWPGPVVLVDATPPDYDGTQAE